MLNYTPTPVQEIHHDTLDEAGVKLFVKREDLNHPYISGNKWWKLKYNLENAYAQKKQTVLTFGGAYSNHIYAMAAAAKETGFSSIGIIRGEETLPLNSTLAFAKTCGMEIHYISRKDYRNKTDKSLIEDLKIRFGNFYMIPEGGTNEFAVKGCAEFAREHIKEIHPDYFCLAVGTGGTMAGVIEGLEDKIEVIGFPVLTGGEFLYQEIRNLLGNSMADTYTKWRLETSYHHGGYAKSTQALTDFIVKMHTHHNLPLDHVYTAKLLWGVFDCVKKGCFKRNSTILALHSGGLQGTSNFIKYGSV